MYYHHTHCQSSISQIINFVTQNIIPVISLIVSVIALRIAQKITLKKTIKDRQFDLMFKLVDLLSETEINLYWNNNKGGSGISGMRLCHLYYSNFKEQNDDLFGRKKMYFQIDSFQDYKFLKLLGNPLIPEEIRTLMEKFTIKPTPQFTYKDIDETGDYVVNITLHQKVDEIKYIEMKYADLYTFEEFHKLVIQLFETMNAWFERYDVREMRFKNDLKMN